MPGAGAGRAGRRAAPAGAAAGGHRGRGAAPRNLHGPCLCPRHPLPSLHRAGTALAHPPPPPAPPKPTQRPLPPRDPLGLRDGAGGPGAFGGVSPGVGGLSGALWGAQGGDRVHLGRVGPFLGRRNEPGGYLGASRVCFQGRVLLGGTHRLGGWGQPRQRLGGSWGCSGCFGVCWWVLGCSTIPPTRCAPARAAGCCGGRWCPTAMGWGWGTWPPQTPTTPPALPGVCVWPSPPSPAATRPRPPAWGLRCREPSTASGGCCATTAPPDISKPPHCGTPLSDTGPWVIPSDP